MFTRISEYMQAVVKKDLFVVSNMEVDPMIEFHLDIVFPNAPCGGKSIQSIPCLLKYKA